MDIFSHGLWAGAVGKGLNDFILKPKLKKPLKLKWLVLWGIFPDIFSFAIPFIWLFWSLAFGNFKLSDLPRPESMEPAASNHLPWVFQLANFLYNFSHSFVIFLLIFAVVFIIFKRPVWELSGWLLHIIIDIPTHSYQFYPTPFLWPVSSIKFNGFSWATPWFLIANYAAIFLVYLILFIKKKKRDRI